MDPIVIVGAGQAGATLAIELRRLGSTEDVVLLGEEVHAPYERPPLSKELIKRTMTPEQLQIQQPQFYAENGIHLRMGARVSAIDLGAQRVHTESGEDQLYSRLVLATGSTPRSLPMLEPDGVSVFSFRTLEDALTLRGRAGPRHRMAIIGGGLIGSELASTFTSQGVQVSIIDPANRPMAHALVAELGELAESLLAEQRVMFHWRATVASVSRNDKAIQLMLSSGVIVEADTVVVCAGTVPNLALAQAAGLHVGAGIKVDQHGYTSAPGVHAIGDCAEFYHPLYEHHVRLEQWQHASNHARSVAALLHGNSYDYTYVPWAWTEVAGHRLALLGSRIGEDEVLWVGPFQAIGSVAIMCKGDQAIGAQGFISSRTANRVKKALKDSMTAGQLADICVADMVRA